MKRVALVNPIRQRRGVAPVALEYLMSGLRRRGIESEVLDLCYCRDSAGEVRRFFQSRPFDLVGVTFRNLDDVWFGQWFLPKLARVVKEIKQATAVPVVVGGSGYSIAPRRILDESGADLGVVGEGEDALPFLAECAGDRSRYPEVPGLVWREGSEVRINPSGTLDLCSLRLADRSAIPHDRYTYAGGKKGGAGVQTKRGCDQNCIYCVVPNIEGRQIRLRPTSDIVEEIGNLCESGVRRFFICDSEFNVPEEHAASICSEIVSAGLGERIVWQAYVSPVPFSLELAQLMKRAGCETIFCTTDHGNDLMLERLGKNFRVEDIRRAVAVARSAGLSAIYSLMLGGPGETMATVEEAVGMVMALRPIKINLSDPPGIRIYPNTPIADIVRQEGFSRKNPNLQGRIEGNDDFFEPVFYLSRGLGVLGRAIRLWRALGGLRTRVLA